MHLAMWWNYRKLQLWPRK